VLRGSAGNVYRKCVEDYSCQEFSSLTQNVEMCIPLLIVNSKTHFFSWTIFPTIILLSRGTVMQTPTLTFRGVCRALE
jgi:hypothetical protein